MAIGPNHEDGAHAPSGGKAPGASAEHESPPVMHLEDHHIKKLFGKKMPPIGSKIKVHGLIHVGAYSENQADNPSGGKASGGEGNTKRTMALHFHKMDMGDGNNSGQKGVDQSAEAAKGAKAEMDKALSREAGGGKKGKKVKDSEGEEDGKESTPRGGGD